MPDVQYKSWVIEPQSYKSDGERWRPKALVSIHEGGSVRVHHVAAPLDVMRDTEVDANEGLRHRRSPLASLAPHQPRPARDAARALERGGVAAGQGRVQEGAPESDPARGVV